MIEPETFAKIPKLPQRQDSTSDQLKDLIIVANKLGMYDAATISLRLCTNTSINE